jgi:hypothetical protein
MTCDYVHHHALIVIKEVMMMMTMTMLMFQESVAGFSPEERQEILRQLAKACKQQGSYHLGCKMYTQASVKPPTFIDVATGSPVPIL